MLLVEVGDTTLSYDRNRKASLYATVGIADYWIANLLDGRVEVHRRPVADNASHYGYRYSVVRTLCRGDVVDVLALPSAMIAVTALLG